MAKKLIASKKIKVFIDKGYLAKIPTIKKESVSWKGCYYTINKNETFFFMRGNNYDKSWFRLNNGAEFLIECGNPESFIIRNEVKSTIKRK